MTIKRRLFITNMMMLVIPIILSVMVVAGMSLALMGMFGIRINDFNEADKFNYVVTKAQSFSKKWSDSDIEQIKIDISSFNINYSEGSISLVVYQDGERLYSLGVFEDNPIILSALSEKGDNYFSRNNHYIYSMDAGNYKIIVMDTNYKFFRGFNNNLTDNHGFLIIFPILIFTVIIIIVFLTNRFLTRIVVKRIIVPLDMLVYGVHQIRDGNLDYRIEYKGKDEFAGVCSDFNEMAQHLKNMVNSRQKDEESRKELIAGISHDLRTPLTSITTYVEGIELGMATTPQMQKHYFDTIKNKTKDLEHIINQLFLFSKLDIDEYPTQMEMLDLGKWLTDFIRGISDEYGQKGLRIELTNNIQGTKVRADRLQLGNVLTNILENSLKYCANNDKIVRVSCGIEDDGAVVILSDNGTGVPDDDLEKLFNIFYRGDKARSNTSQGSGLGLAISLKIMQRLGGSIKAENLPEGGLSVSLTLPIFEVEGEKN
ncbi:MAG: signal transduction histidine kinase [Herbinix sp.]|jgi:signal transduction histidine kinase|nr:signal transduction histidine kinase [Herbinix sp.]MDF2870035.1 signal transduction histidine kinase [Anaerocolumna sp.]